jgi:hypothetical protein
MGFESRSTMLHDPVCGKLLVRPTMELEGRELWISKLLDILKL